MMEAMKPMYGDIERNHDTTLSEVDSAAELFLKEEKHDVRSLICDAVEILQVNGQGDCIEEHEIFGGSIDEDFDRESDCNEEEDELLGALDWLDLCDDLQSRGTGQGLAAITGSRICQNRRPNAHGGLHNAQFLARGSLQPRANRHQKFISHIHAGPLSEWEGQTKVAMSNSVTTEVRQSVKQQAEGRTRVTEKSDRATVEQALDPRTRMVLFKMLNRGVFSNINGCISTGKEANVYHATKDNGDEFAVKVYKTSILVFKDREKYVQGDFRFRHGYCKHNPRKMVKTWAEKEMRNLSRLRAAGILSPTPLLLRLHVLVMSFIGKNGWAAPRLKDAVLTELKFRECYLEIIVVMRIMYQRCRLVHGDLSEYNILYHEGHLHIIDVSQSVDLDHPRALDFLRQDCLHINDFFRKSGVAVMNTRELFDFVVDSTLPNDQVDEYLEKIQENIRDRGFLTTAEEQVADAVFLQSYIPRTLDQVKDYEGDIERITSGKGTEGIYYQTITGLKDDLSGVRHITSVLQENTPEGSLGAGIDTPVRKIDMKNNIIKAVAPASQEERNIDDSYSDANSSISISCEDQEEESSGEEMDVLEANHVEKDDARSARKEHKKQVKAEKREARKTKVPKAVKKKRRKLSKDKKMKH
ncbi:hypothetical protein O6H91_18G073500 [Diphasiastrum complanatum]|uniref:Uncharacterized protein n=1 Tax=Diphasiastrum complanatum TaxID=34168 RepID=A0ACC2B2K2_DIPCM|nr:hypothetical protein O6H91_18G073500 [Diphasiastrum complanatum]